MSGQQDKGLSGQVVRRYAMLVSYKRVSKAKSIVNSPRHVISKQGQQGQQGSKTCLQVSCKKLKAIQQCSIIICSIISFVKSLISCARILY